MFRIMPLEVINANCITAFVLLPVSIAQPTSDPEAPFVKIEDYANVAVIEFESGAMTFVLGEDDMKNMKDKIKKALLDTGNFMGVIDYDNNIYALFKRSNVCRISMIDNVQSVGDVREDDSLKAMIDHPQNLGYPENSVMFIDVGRGQVKKVKDLVFFDTKHSISQFFSYVAPVYDVDLKKLSSVLENGKIFYVEHNSDEGDKVGAVGEEIDTTSEDGIT